jgi:hypothetical protein
MKIVKAEVMFHYRKYQNATGHTEAKAHNVYEHVGFIPLQITYPDF